MKTKKMNFKQLALQILITIILVWVGIYVIPTFQPSYDDQYKKKIDSLKTLINVNKEKIESYEIRINNLNDSIKTIDYNLNQNKIKLDKLKKDYDKKMGDIGKYSVDDLNKFFTERYQ